MTHLKLFNRLLIFAYTGTIIIARVSSRCATCNTVTNESENIDASNAEERANTNETTSLDREINRSSAEISIEKNNKVRILAAIQQQFKLDELEILTKTGITNEMFTNVLIRFGNDSENNLLVSICEATAEYYETNSEYYSFSSVRSFLPITFDFFAIMLHYRIGTRRIVLSLKNGVNYILTLRESDLTNLSKYLINTLQLLEAKLKLDKQEINFEHERKLWPGSLFANPRIDAIVKNWNRDKVVLDVIIGLPVMAIEAAKYGASKVYVVRPNAKMANIARKLIDDNSSTKTEDENWKLNIRIIVGNIKTVELEKRVDLIFTEAVGVTQYYEQIYKINIHAAKWLKKHGVMLPTETKFFIAPFTDETIFDELQSKANFWNENVSVVRLKSLYNNAKNQIFSQQFQIDLNAINKMAKEKQFVITYREDTSSTTTSKDFPLNFLVEKDGYVHGLAFWYDSTFMAQKYMPSFTSTLYLQNRIETRKGDTIIGKVILIASPEEIYSLVIELMIKGKPESRLTQLVNLKNKYEF